MQKLYTRLRNLILLLGLASVLFLIGTVVVERIQNPGLKNDRYFSKQAKELIQRIRPGMSQAEVDTILDEYDFIAVFEVERPRIIEIHGEETEISSYYELTLGGDPTNSGVITNCGMLIVFYQDPLIERKVGSISDATVPGYCGRLGYYGN